MVIEKFLARLKEIYSAMDRAYEDTASHYGFTCKGCDDNCCTQRFHHHTLSEYYYLFEGVKQTDDELLKKILMRARIVTDTYLKEIEIGEILNVMCPVNFDGLCRLYEHRPMICRLHGLPYSFKRPDGGLIEGEGCHRFQGSMPPARKGSMTPRIDRTPFYTELARLEKELRSWLNFNRRYKKTTAEMLMDMAEALEAGTG